MIALALDPVEQLVNDVVTETISARHCLAILRSRRLTADAAALSDAVHHLRRIDGLLSGALDPAVLYPDWAGIGGRLAHAVEQAEDGLTVALTALSHRPARAVA